MTARLLDFAPDAWQAYQDIRDSDLGKLVRRVLEGVAEDPEVVRSDPQSTRYQVVEERLRRAQEVWGLRVDAPDGTTWLVVWLEMPYAIEIGYIGPAAARAA